MNEFFFWYQFTGLKAFKWIVVAVHICVFLNVTFVHNFC